MKNNKGFSLIEGLLILVIVGLLGGTGWYVWHAKSNSDKSNNAATQASNTPATSNTKPAVTDPTADWLAYSSKSGQFSLKYPKTWIMATHPELCSPGILLLGADAKSVGACASENFGEISVTSQNGPGDIDGEFGNGYSKVVKEVVVVDGIKAIKGTGTPNWGTDNQPTVVVKYVIDANNKSYTVTYSKSPSYPNVLGDFDLMVTKTLKFSS